MKFKNTKEGLMAIRPEMSESYQTEVMGIAYKVFDCVEGKRYGEAALIMALGYGLANSVPTPTARKVEQVCEAIKASVAGNLEAKQVYLTRTVGGES